MYVNLVLTRYLKEKRPFEAGITLMIRNTRHLQNRRLVTQNRKGVAIDPTCIYIGRL